MKIGIIQADGKLPNLALMKITGYHLEQGDHVEWYQGDLFNDYDKVYCSKIFSFTQLPPLPDNCIIGGTGVDFYNRLPDEIENAKPSYHLYNCDYHLGFSMKGCRFACKFCCVPKKEGKPYNYNTIDEILINPNAKNKLMLLDNDFFGGENWRENLNRMIELKLKVCFCQGLNIRIITSEQAELLAKVNYMNSKFLHKYITFAWDKFNDEKLILDGIERCVKAGIPTKNMQFFVLIGYDTTPEQDLYRVEMLRDLGALPYVMPYNKSDYYQKRFTRWVNHRAIFKTVEFNNYI